MNWLVTFLVLYMTFAIVLPVAFIYLIVAEGLRGFLQIVLICWTLFVVADETDQRRRR